MPELQSHPTPHYLQDTKSPEIRKLNPTRDEVEGKKLPPYQLFPCNFYKR